MFASTFVKVTTAIALLELLVVGLLLPSTAWNHSRTLIAAALYAIAWASAVATGHRVVGINTGRASAISSVPLLVAALGWGLLSGLILWAAKLLGLKWVLGFHGIAALILWGSSALFKGVGSYADRIDASAASGSIASEDISHAIAQARINLSRLQIDRSLRQRIGTLLEKAQAQSRAELSQPHTASVLNAIQAVASVQDTSGAIVASDAIESALIGKSH